MLNEQFCSLKKTNTETETNRMLLQYKQLSQHIYLKVTVQHETMRNNIMVLTWKINNPNF